MKHPMTDADLDAALAGLVVPDDLAGLTDPTPAAPLVSGIPIHAGRQQCQGDVGFAPTRDRRPHWAQHIGSAVVTLVDTDSTRTRPGNGHQLRAVTAGRGRVYWAEVEDPGDEHVIGFVEVVGGPDEAVAVIEQPTPGGHAPLALGEGRYWVCRQMCIGPDLRKYRVID